MVVGLVVDGVEVGGVGDEVGVDGRSDVGGVVVDFGSDDPLYWYEWCVEYNLRCIL